MPAFRRRWAWAARVVTPVVHPGLPGSLRRDHLSAAIISAPRSSQRRDHLRGWSSCCCSPFTEHGMAGVSRDQAGYCASRHRARSQAPEGLLSPLSARQPRRPPVPKQGSAAPSKPGYCSANGKPTSTEESTSGASTSGRKMPATYSHMPPPPLTPVIQIRSPASTWSMPSSCAAAAPSTQTGSRAVAVLRNSQGPRWCRWCGAPPGSRQPRSARS
jgi:hypothetical protein